ncbi:ABC transporter substrate-binding protein [Bradyrhizobium guangdongense]|uniref:ABC transporter substrate-binding protein n=1 Tax=Bradyrhizobium guangdongense TaxID=1325090 RepID=UPI0018F7D246|nr:ABC transporter substrate-binding protein [Bradyrhizobium guangdongense]
MSREIIDCPHSLYVAADKGLFAKHGLDADLSTAGAIALPVPILLSGRGQIGVTSPGMSISRARTSARHSGRLANGQCPRAFGLILSEPRCERAGIRIERRITGEHGWPSLIYSGSRALAPSFTRNGIRSFRS